MSLDSRPIIPEVSVRRRAVAPQGEGPRRRLSLPLLALLALCVGTFIGFLAYPTYPNYDSYYSLIWGRELLHGITPSFEAYRAPTEHPLAIAFGAVLSLLGEGGDRVMVFCTLVSFVALCAGVYRLGKAAFGPVVGLIAGALVVTRFDFPFLAARAYIDIPYLAFIVWAAALEAEKPRRGRLVLGLLALAAMMRPEAWLIISVYWLWLSWPTADNPLSNVRRRVEDAAITAAGPLIWVLTDFAVTGDPTFSLTHTSGLAEELGRQRDVSEVPAATVEFLKNLDKIPVFYAGVAGVIMAVILVPRRLYMPAALLVIGIGTFFLVGFAGLSVIDRYLLVPSLMVMVFAAVTLGGWSMLEPSRWRTAWMAGAVVVVAYGTVYTVTHVNFHAFTNELKFRGQSHRALKRTLDDPAVAAGRACGPVSFANHKLLPDIRWVLDAKVDDVVARSAIRTAARQKATPEDKKLGRQAELAQKGGVAILATNRSALLRQAIVEDYDRIEDNLPPAGFEGPKATSGFYAAFVGCPSSR